MNRLVLTYVAAALALTALALACSSGSQVATDKTAADSVLMPDAEGYGLTINVYNRGQVTAVIHSQHMRQYLALDSTMARVVDIDTFDSTGHVTGKLVGDSAVVRENAGRLDVFGHVVFISGDTTRLETEYLKWNPDIRQVETDAFVRITRGKDWATGWIFRADLDLKRWQILKDFQGTFFGLPPGETLE